MGLPRGEVRDACVRGPGGATGPGLEAMLPERVLVCML
jgi:hypothetical protein